MRILLLMTMLTLAACGSQLPPKSVDEINQLVAIAEKAIGATEKFNARAPDADTHAAMQELFTALNTARNQTDEIIRQVAASKYLGRHSIDPMDDVSVCVRANLASAYSIEEMSETSVGLWALGDLGECAMNATIYYESVSVDDGAAAALAVSVIWPITIVAKAKAGFRKGWLQGYLSVNEQIITRLERECRGEKNTASAGNQAVRYECAAYAVAIAIRPKLQALASQALTPG